MSQKYKWVLLSIGLVFLLSVSAPALAGKPQLKVMTRNLYVGADIFRVVDAIDDPDPLAIPTAVAGIMQIISETDFAARAEAIADEIDRYKPHIIGLQEVSLIRTETPGDFLTGNLLPDAEEVAYDFLDLLMKALAKRKLKYTVAASVQNADVELPMLTETFPFTDVRLTDRDVILVRKGVKVSNVVEQNYTYNLSIPGTPITFTRGFAAVDAKIDGYPYRFVNTHLEVGGDITTDLGPVLRQIQAAQMYELLQILSYESLPVILVGDFNSSPEDVPIFDIIPPYMQAMYAGYIDVWSLRNKPPGMTCCFDEFVSDPYATLYERIDHILISPNGLMPKKARTVIVGDKVQDMTETELPLWPSDHAGVVGQIDFFEP